MFNKYQLSGRYYPESKPEEEDFRKIRDVPRVRLTVEEQEYPNHLKEVVVTVKKCKQKDYFHLISPSYLQHMLRFSESDVPAVCPSKGGYQTAIFSYGDRSTNFHLKWKLQECRCELMTRWLTAYVSKGKLPFFGVDRGSKAIDVEKMLKEEELVAAEWVVDGEWYRGQIVSLTDDNATVYFIDVGCTEVVWIDFLRCLPEELQRIPPMAFRCKLADIALDTDEDAICQGQAQLYFISKLRESQAILCRIRSLENEDSILKQKATVQLKYVEQSGIHGTWEKQFDTINALVREKLVWKSSSKRLEDDKPLAEEFPAFREANLPISAEIPQRTISGSPCTYQLVSAMCPQVIYIRQISSEDEERDNEMQDAYRRRHLAHTSKYSISTSRIFRNRYYVWRDAIRDHWYRVKVIRTDTPPGTCFAFRIDHGDHLLIDTFYMMELNPKFYEWPSRAIKCHLVHLQNKGPFSKDESSSLFSELVGKDYLGVALSHEDIRPRGCQLHQGMSYGIMVIDESFRSGYTLQARLLLSGHFASMGFTCGNPHIPYLHHSAVPDYNREEMLASVQEEFGVNISESFEDETVGKEEEDLSSDFAGLSPDWTVFRGSPSIQPRYVGKGRRQTATTYRCSCKRSCSSDCFYAWSNKNSRRKLEPRQSYRYLKCLGNAPAETQTTPGPFTEKFGRYLGAIRISHVNGPGVFYIQNLSDIPTLKKMTDDLAQVANLDAMKLEDDEDLIGLLASAYVLTESGRRKWHRVYVSKVFHDRKVAKVILYDVGSVMNVSISDIRDLPKYFMLIPPFCRRCHLDVPPYCLRNHFWTANQDELFSAFVNLNANSVYFGWKPRLGFEDIVQLLDYGQGVAYHPVKQHWWNGGELTADADYPVVVQNDRDKKLLYHLLNSIGINLCYESLNPGAEFFEFETVEKMFL